LCNGVDENCDGSDRLCTFLVIDSSFDESSDSVDLRANSKDQGWYESRGQNPSLLTLDTSMVMGNSGKKAKLSGTNVSQIMHI
jgi:hypothetical protein